MSNFTVGQVIRSTTDYSEGYFVVLWVDDHGVLVQATSALQGLIASIR